MPQQNQEILVSPSSAPGLFIPASTALVPNSVTQRQHELQFKIKSSTSEVHLEDDARGNPACLVQASIIATPLPEREWRPPDASALRGG
jgi:hypothetical protein